MVLEGVRCRISRATYKIFARIVISLAGSYESRGLSRHDKDVLWRVAVRMAELMIADCNTYAHQVIAISPMQKLGSYIVVDHPKHGNERATNCCLHARNISPRSCRALLQRRRSTRSLLILDLDKHHLKSFTPPFHPPLFRGRFASPATWRTPHQLWPQTSVPSYRSLLIDVDCTA